MKPHPPLRPLHETLWECDAPFGVLGMQIGHRMAVVRLRDGGLLVHSPVAATPETRAAVDALGEVRWIVAPSRIHDTFVDGWFAAYPKAGLVGAPGMRADFPQWPWRGELGPGFAGPWAPELEFLVVDGIPRVNETVFLHRPSRTLLVADLIFNVGHEDPSAWSRFMLRVNGCCGQATSSRLFRSVVKDRAAFRRSVDRILDWDFDRVLVGHGRNLETDAKDVLRESFRWLA